MNAIAIAAFGGPENLQLMEMPEPRPRAGEALVKLEYAGVNFIDIYMRSGRYAKLLIKVLYLPEAVTSAFVVLFCFVAAFSARNNVTDLWMIVAFGVVGYLFEKYKFPIAPMVLGCILGTQAESSFMTSMISYQNDWTVFFTRPISGMVMVFVIIALTYPLFRHLRQEYKKRHVPLSAG